MSKIRLTTQFAALDNSIQALHADLADRLGIQPIALEVLDQLYQQDGQRPSDLANSVGRAATSFTPVLDRMEKAGLIRRKPDMEDRRAVRILLTAEARTLGNEITEHMEAVDLEVKQALLDRISVPVPSDFLETLIAPLPAAEPF